MRNPSVARWHSGHEFREDLDGSGEGVSSGAFFLAGDRFVDCSNLSARLDAVDGAPNIPFCKVVMRGTQDD